MANDVHSGRSHEMCKTPSFLRESKPRLRRKIDAVRQQSLFPQAKPTSFSLLPQGLRYRQDFVTENEEQALARALSQLELKPFEFHGYLGNRRVLSFGLRYDYSRRGVESAAPPPQILDALRVRVAEFAGRSPEEFRQIGSTSTAQALESAGIKTNRNSATGWASLCFHPSECGFASIAATAGCVRSTFLRRGPYTF